MKDYFVKESPYWPTPGSSEASYMGCECPVRKNNGENGYKKEGDSTFYLIHPICNLHSSQEEIDEYFRGAN